METGNIETEHPKVVVKKIIQASREKVFDAWTKPELMQQWFFPKGWAGRTENNLRVGGSYNHTMISESDRSECGTDVEPGPDGKCYYPHTGEYLHIKAPEQLVFTWNSPAVRNTRVTVDLRSVENGTEVTITHELLPSEAERMSHTEGWIGCLSHLAEFLPNH